MFVCYVPGVDFCVGCIQGPQRHNWAFISIQDTAASLAAQNPCLSCCEPLPDPLESSAVLIAVLDVRLLLLQVQTEWYVRWRLP